MVMCRDEHLTLPKLLHPLCLHLSIYRLIQHQPQIFDVTIFDVTIFDVTVFDVTVFDVYIFAAYTFNVNMFDTLLTYFFEIFQLAE